MRGALSQQHHKVGPDKRHPICIMTFGPTVTFVPSWQISTILLEYVCSLSSRSSHIKGSYESLSCFRICMGWEQSEPKISRTITYSNIDNLSCWKKYATNGGLCECRSLIRAVNYQRKHERLATTGRRVRVGSGAGVIGDI